MNQLITTFVSNQLSPQTRAVYTRDIQVFLQYVGIPLADVTEGHIISYRNHLASKLAPASVNRMLSTVRSLYTWGVNTGHVASNPALFVKSMPHQSDSKTPGISDTDALRLMASVKGMTAIRDTAILTTLLHLGLRRSELCHIKLSDITADRETARALSIQGKGGKVRMLPLFGAVDEALQKHISNTFFEQNTLMPQETYIFHAHKNTGKPMHPATVRKIVNKYCKLAGIPIISPHSLRATAASNAIDNGANFVELQYAFGWSNPAMVNRYDKRRSQMKNSAVLKINYGSK